MVPRHPQHGIGVGGWRALIKVHMARVYTPLAASSCAVIRDQGARARDVVEVFTVRSWCVLIGLLLGVRGSRLTWKVWPHPVPQCVSSIEDEGGGLNY
jgi:hypothetical protein